MQLNPEVTVAAIVMRERISGRLVLNQPAGHLEDRETLVEAVVRETREETAWGFHPEALVGTYLWRNPVNGRSFLRFAFCGAVDDHHPQQALDKGIVRALWLTAAELQVQPARLRSPLVMRCIEDFQQGRRQPLDSVSELDLQTSLAFPAVVSL
jgi:8-oxo-dGTP pyrophosphatase MutT (NUDIX family)